VTSEEYKNLKMDNRWHVDWNPSHAARIESVQAADTTSQQRTSHTTTLTVKNVGSVQMVKNMKGI
jgi:hypothetical protein